MKTPEILSRKKIFDAFFALEEIKLKNENGGEDLTRHIIIPKKAVAVLLYRRDNRKVVFSKQYRIAVDKWLLEIPAGVMDAKHEKPDETACRECLEETGYEVNEPEFISSFYPSPGNSAENIRLYFAEVAGNDKIARGGGLDDENEHIKVVEMDFNEALRLVDAGEITDGKTVMALLWLHRKLGQAIK